MAGKIHSPSTLGQVRIIAWLRWRLFANAMRSGSAKLEFLAGVVVAVVAVVIAVLIAFALGSVAYVVMQRRPERIGAIIWGVFLAGQILPVIVSASTSSMDTRSLLRFPLRFSAYVALALSYCAFDPSSLASLLWLGSVGVGAAVARPESAHWILATTGLLSLVAVLMNRMVLLWVERVMARRRSRETAFLVFIIGILSIQLVGATLQRFEAQLRPLLEAARPYLGVLPPGLAGGAFRLAGSSPQDTALLLLALAAWSALVFLLLRRRLLAQYRGELVAEAATVLAQGKAGAERAGMFERLAHLFPGQRAALLGKEFRYLTRNVVTLTNLCIPFFLIVFFGLLLDQKDSELSFFQRRPEAVLPSAMGYSVFIGMPMAHNVLSFESWGLQLLLLAPVRFREVFLAKNLALGLALVGQAVAVYLLVSVLFGPQQPVIVVATFVALLFMLLLNFSVGNLLSLYFPRSFDFGSFSQRQSPWSVIVGIAVQLIGMLMVYGVYAVALWRGNTWYAVIAYALMCAAMLQVYFMVLERCDELTDQRREILVHHICRK